MKRLWYFVPVMAVVWCLWLISVGCHIRDVTLSFSVRVSHAFQREHIVLSELYKASTCKKTKIWLLNTGSRITQVVFLLSTLTRVCKAGLKKDRVCKKNYEFFCSYAFICIRFCSVLMVVPYFLAVNFMLCCRFRGDKYVVSICTVWVELILAFR